MKKLIAILLAVAMIMGLAVVASADDSWVVDCPTWWGGHSAPVVLSETVQTWTFNSTTYADATDYYATPTVVVWRSNTGVMGGDGYIEELLVRSDCFAVSQENTWGTDGENAYGGKTYPADWAAWVAANQAGTTCTVTAQLTNGYIVVGFSNTDVTNIYMVPVDTTSDSPIYLSMTGERCTMTNWAASDEHIDISAACESVGGTMNLPSTGGDDTTTGGDDTTTGGDDTTTGGDDTTTGGDDTTTGGDDTTTGGDDTTTGGDDTTTGGDDTTTEDKEDAPVVKDPYTLPDLDCTGWWKAHSEGIELDEAGVQITFKSSTYESASSNWNGPLWILYTGSEAKVNGAGYMEYWVHRLDNYGWGNNSYYKVTLPADDAEAALNTAYPDLIAAAGIKHEATFAEGFVWEELVANLKAGVDVTVFAQLVGKNAVITMTGAGITNTMTIPVDTSKPVYLSLSGELNTITDIDVIPQTGDATNLIALGAAMVLAVAGAAAITVGKKKFF